MKRVTRSAAGLWSAAFLLAAGTATAAENAQSPPATPAEVQLLPEKDGVASADQARQVLGLFARYDAEMAYCGRKLDDPDTFTSAHEDWLKRNLYLREQAYNVLTYRKADADEGTITAKAEAEIARAYSEVGDVAAACRGEVDAIRAGNADIEVTDPGLADLMYKSTQALDNRHPDSVGAPG